MELDLTSIPTSPVAKDTQPTPQERKCPGGFLRSYLEYTSGYEPPEEFHFWVGIFLIASCLGRNVHLRFGRGRLYPNTYMFIVGPSGCGKSTAGDLGIALLETMKLKDVFQGKITMSALLKRLHERYKTHGSSEIIVYASELKTLMGGSQSNSSIVEDLTHMYGAGDIWTYETNIGGKIDIFNLCVNLLGCSTPEWLSTGVKGSEFINSGFAARFLMVYKGDTPRCFPFPVMPENWRELEATMLHDLSSITAMKGEFTITTPAREMYEEWYVHRYEGTTLDERFSSYADRKRTHVLKVAMLLHAGRSNTMIIDESDIRGALAALRSIEDGMHTIYKNVAYHIEAQISDAILRCMIKAPSGKMTRGEIMRRVGYKAERKIVDEALIGLEEKGDLRKILEVRSGVVTYYLNLQPVGE